MSKLQDVENAVVSGKSKLVAGLVQEALDEGCSAPDILNGMINAMGIVGERFKKNEIFVPEMLVAARAMKKGVDVLKPHLASGSAGVCGKAIIGTVAGDLHDIGKNLVAMMIEVPDLKSLTSELTFRLKNSSKPLKQIQMLKLSDVLHFLPQPCLH